MDTSVINIINKAIIHEAILKKMSVGGNISDKKVNRREGKFYFF